MKIRPEAELTGWIRISAPPASAASATDRAKATVFTRTGSTPISRKGFAVLRDRRDRATEKSRLQEDVQPRERHERNGRRNDHAQRQVDLAQRDHAVRVRRLDEPLVGSPNHQERSLDEEHQAEEEGEASNRFVAAPLEEEMIDSIEGGAGEREEAPRQ